MLPLAVLVDLKVALSFPRFDVVKTKEVQKLWLIAIPFSGRGLLPKLQNAIRINW